jgi:hypothetical protein
MNGCLATDHLFRPISSHAAATHNFILQRLTIC